MSEEKIPEIMFVASDPYGGGTETARVDMVNHPPHYQSSAACSACHREIECIDITRHMEFNIGNAMKYLWRYQQKNGIEDLKKAIWYIQDQIKVLERK